MITGLVAKNYGCLKDVDVRFSGLHALIGPNDSGKSTILRALRSLSSLMNSQFIKQDGTWHPFDPGFDEAGGIADSMLIRAVTDDGAYSFEKFESLQMGGRGAVTETRETISSGTEELVLPRYPDGGSPLQSVPPPDWRYTVVQALSRVHFLALSEDGLRAPSGFMRRDALKLTTRGEGLPGLYFALRNDREEAFERIIQRVRWLFPTVKTVRPQPRSSTELELEVELASGARVRAPHISTGLLYFLAFAALSETTDLRQTLLLEEPENGLHPARIKEVMAVMREVHKTHDVQIIMTTHSPLVINELTPDEVSVVTRPSLEQGTVVTPIKETANFEKRAGVYALGELWLSYADGLDRGAALLADRAMKLFFAGEGVDDIGDWAGHAAYKPVEEECPGRGGILHALVARVATGHRAVGGIEWKKIRKFKAGDHRATETRNVLGVALDADELGCDALIFGRDRDRDVERERDIELGIQAAAAMFVQLRIVGGTANEECEAWLLALLGDAKAESYTDPKAILIKRHGIDDRGEKRDVVSGANLDAVPADCRSLVRWLERARDVLA